MKLGFNVWLPLVSVFIVLLSVALMVSYGLSTTSSRIEDYARGRLDAQALEAARAVRDSGSSGEARNALRQAANVNEGEALFVGLDGEVVDRAGRELVPSEQNLLRRLVGEATREGPSSEELVHDQATSRGTERCS